MSTPVSLLQGADPKFATISASASADLIALSTGRIISVVALYLVATTAVTVQFQTGGATNISGAMPLGANGGIVLPFNPAGWFQTAAGAKLNMVLGGSVAVAGGITYILI